MGVMGFSISGLGFCKVLKRVGCRGWRKLLNLASCRRLDYEDEAQYLRNLKISTYVYIMLLLAKIICMR